MTNPSKAKGTTHETRVVKYLQANGYPDAKRRALTGNADQGDLTVGHGVIAEIKYRADKYTARDINGWIREAWTELNNARAAVCLLIVLGKGDQVPSALTIRVTQLGPTWVGSLEQWVHGG